MGMGKRSVRHCENLVRGGPVILERSKATRPRPLSDGLILENLSVHR